MSAVDFTHDRPGTPASAHQQHPAWASGCPLTLEGVSRVVVLAAHPDDESLGAGGLVVVAHRAGLRVDLVCVTDGEGSHPRSPSTSPARLASLRRREWAAAAAVLGVPDARLHRLALPDGRVAEHGGAVTRALVDLIGDGRGCVLVAPWREDGHPDHDAAGRAAAAAARRTGAQLWEYPIWFWHRAPPEAVPWSRLRPIGLDDAARETKRTAIAAHVSQVSPLSGAPGDETLLSAAFLRHFEAGIEHVLVTAGAQCPDDALDNLHRSTEEPWQVDERWYEQRKRDLVLATLPRRRFRRALEVGCSTGALAEALASRSDEVLAIDRSPAALEGARRRLHTVAGVQLRQLDVPDEWPARGDHDLVVVSEVGYFLSPGDLELLAARIARSMPSDGVLVLCHWRHPVAGWVLDAAAVHRGFLDAGVAPLQATYTDRDIEIRVHAHDRSWPDPHR